MLLKKTGEQFSALLSPNTGNKVDLVIESWVVAYVVQTQAGPGKKVRRSVDDTRQACIHRSATTHCAGFECYRQSAVKEAPTADHLGRVAQRKDLGMSGRISREFSFVMPTSDDLTFVHDNGADGHITVLQRSRRLGESQAKKFIISHDDTLAIPPGDHRP